MDQVKFGRQISKTNFTWSILEYFTPNVEKTKIIISSENAGKVTEEDELLCAVCRKDLDSNSILCQIWWFRLHEECSGIRGKLKEDSKVKF